MTQEYEIRTYASIVADSLKEAEAIYSAGNYFVDYHEIVVIDENGETTYDQLDIEAMEDED